MRQQSGQVAAIGTIGWRPDELALLRSLAGDDRELTLSTAEDGAPWAALTSEGGHDFHFARIGAVVLGAIPERGFSVRAGTLDGVLSALSALAHLSTRRGNNQQLATRTQDDDVRTYDRR